VIPIETAPFFCVCPVYWEANSFSASEIPYTLFNLNVHHRVHNSLLSVPVLVQTSVLRTLLFHLFKILCIILPSMPGSSCWSFSFAICYQSFEVWFCSLLCVLRAPPISSSFLIWPE
jgi:hypothetical protein